MAITKAKKIALVESLRTILHSAETTVFVAFKKLSVADTTRMRRALSEEGVSYTVVKKTLLKRALDEKGYTGEMPDLPGEVAVVYGTDPLAPARSVRPFTKQFGDGLNFLGGIFGGAFQNAAEITSIASIPSREVLYGQIANVVNSPLSGLVVALSAIAKNKE